MKLLKFFKRRRQREQELDEEIRTHLAMAVRERIERGEDPAEAEANARREFGNVGLVKDVTRDMWGRRWLETLLQDLRYGLRQLRRNPGFTIVAVLTLALGIGANTATFTAANDFLLRRLPFGNSGRVVMVKWHDQKLARSGWFDPSTFEYLQERNHVFEDMAAWDETTHDFNLTGAEGPERVRGKQVTRAFFRVLGVKPVLGRTFSADEERQHGNRVALISHALWQSRFGESSSILGKTIILDGKDYAVIGVLPAGFRFSTPPEDVWTPLSISFKEGYGGYFLNVIACLKPGVSLARAQANMTAVFGQFARQFPQWAQGHKIMVASLRDRYDRELKPALLALMLAAALVLLIACSNLANLLLARAGTRCNEIAIRRALGANRARIVRQMLIESSLLALLAGGGGLLIAYPSAHILYAELPAGWQPLTRGGISFPVLLFALAVSLLSVFLFGLAPAWGAAGFDLRNGLKEGSRAPLAAARGRSFRAALVAGEISLAVVLLTGAGLLIKSFARLAAVNMGFRPQNVLTIRIARNRSSGQDAFYNRVVDRIAALPRVRAVGAVNFIPLSGSGWSQDITIEGRPPRPHGDYIWATHRDVTLGYFRAMGIPLLKGRLFAATDWDKPDAVVSETMARRYWPGEDPIGKRFGINCSESKCKWNTIIGVVGDVKELGAAAAPATAMYFLGTGSDMTLVVRSTRNPTGLVRDIRGVIHSTDPDQPLGDIRTMRSVVSEFIAPQRLTSLISGLFAALALLLSCVGIYGVMAFSVTRRTHEIGVRMALGAQKGDVLRMVVGQGLKLVIIGVAIGIAGALALTRFLSSLLYGVKPTDPLTFVAVSLILIVVALLACYIPARRAAKVDPMVALRYE